MGKSKEPFVPILIEEVSEGKFRAFNLIDTWCNVIGTGTSIEETIENWKESIQEAIVRSEGKTILSLTPRFFMEEKRRKLDFSSEFPVLIFEKYLKNYSRFIAGSSSTFPKDSNFWKVHGNGDDFKSAKENWLKNYKEILGESKEYKPKFYFEIRYEFIND